MGNTWALTRYLLTTSSFPSRIQYGICLEELQLKRLQCKQCNKNLIRVEKNKLSSELTSCQINSAVEPCFNRLN